MSDDMRRQRRCRDRRRRGTVVVQILVAHRAIRTLVRLGWLRESDCRDQRAIREAVVRIASWAISPEARSARLVIPGLLEESIAAGLASDPAGSAQRTRSRRAARSLR
jgi:hypothetical protein